MSRPSPEQIAVRIASRQAVAAIVLAAFGERSTKTPKKKKGSARRHPQAEPGSNNSREENAVTEMENTTTPTCGATAIVDPVRGVNGFFPSSTNREALGGLTLADLKDLHSALHSLFDVVAGLCCQPRFARVEPAGDFLRELNELVGSGISHVVQEVRTRAPTSKEEARNRTWTVMRHTVFFEEGFSEAVDVFGGVLADDESANFDVLAAGQDPLLALMNEWSEGVRVYGELPDDQCEAHYDEVVSPIIKRVASGQVPAATTANGAAAALRRVLDMEDIHKIDATLVGAALQYFEEKSI